MHIVYNVRGSKLELEKYKYCEKNSCICRREMYRMYFGRKFSSSLFQK